MSKRKGLTAQQRQRMKSDLLERQRWLLNAARGHFDAPGEDDGHGDEGDLANSAVRTDLAMDVKARESRELQMIEHALQKIEEGTYGVCGECGGGIPLPRLEALPFAEYCIDCQEELERVGSFADSASEIPFGDRT